MKKYSYNPELAGPGLGVDISNDSPVMRLYVRWNKLVNQTLSNAWKAPERVKKERISIPVRDGAKISGWLLEPEGNDKRLPAMLYCHGGAFFMPILPSSLAVAAHYVRELGCRVVMPEYRLTPKHRYPIPLDDCCDTLAYMVREASSYKLDMNRLMIYGESAGGCLAAEVTHCCRDEALARPVGQMLIYPVTDSSQDYSSLTEYQFAPWSRLANLNMWKLYLPACLVGESGGQCPWNVKIFRIFLLHMLRLRKLIPYGIRGWPMRRKCGKPAWRCRAKLSPGPTTALMAR